MSSDKFFNKVDELIADIKATQKKNISDAAAVIANSIMSGGIIQAFGSGHSYAAAIEIAGRAGGLIPAKVIEDKAKGQYEVIEGVGKKLMETADINPKDCFVIISNSGRNPLPIEIAQCAKEKSCKIIVVTSYEVSKKLTSRHSSGKKLYDFADVILDNRGTEGDSAIELPGLPVKVCATSSIAAALLLNCTVLEAIEIMLSKGYTPPIYMSENVDGGHEFNNKVKMKYANRIYRQP